MFVLCLKTFLFNIKKIKRIFTDYVQHMKSSGAFVVLLCKKSRVYLGPFGFIRFLYSR